VPPMLDILALMTRRGSRILYPVAALGAPQEGRLSRLDHPKLRLPSLQGHAIQLFLS